MSDPLRIAATVRTACLQAALDAFEDGGVSGLCLEGRWELAVQAIRTLDLPAVLARAGIQENQPQGFPPSRE